MKRVLIISPYFPPVNAADMQRVRMSLPYYKEFGWDAEVVAVDARYTDLPKDELLMESIPADIKIHHVKAFNKSWTGRFGFGSISYRSYWFIRRKVNRLLKKTKFDLVYFSTTQFQICTLGAYWKRKFKVPYVIDMQDPWHSDYYRDKPKEQQPPKYWLSYRINKFLEPIAMEQAGGLISVSTNYIKNIKERYPQIKQIPEATITFSAPGQDLKIANDNESDFQQLLNPDFKNVVYIGRGGMDMYKALTPVFEAIKIGLAKSPQVYKRLKFYFIGTSYAPNGEGALTILPLAKQFGLQDNVIEVADRIGYYQTFATLQAADALFIPGSDDPFYTASKIFPYLLTAKPLLAIFNSKSPALGVLDEFEVKYAYSYDETPGIINKIDFFLKKVVANEMGKQIYNEDTFEKYSARAMAKQQCDLFNSVIITS